MKYLNERLWKSAYLIEFYTNDYLEDVFTFSVPPQNEEFDFAQRVNETKTFGGSVFDDYGNDTVKINLSGTTINQELKIIYQGKNGDKYMTGQDEIFYLRDLLQKYGNYNKLPGKKVYLYSLSGGKKASGGKNQKAWRIFTTEFQIKRSKDMPFTYYYTFSCTGVPIELDAQNRKHSSKILSGIESIKSGMNKVKSAINSTITYLDQYLGYLDDYNNLVAEMNDSVSYCSGIIDQYADMVNGIVSDVYGAATSSMNLMKGVYDMGLSLTKLNPKYIATKLINSTADFVESVNNFTNYIRNKTFSSEMEKISNNFDQSVQNLSDQWTKQTRQMNINANEVYASVVKTTGASGITPAIIPGNGEANDSVVMTNGYTEYVFKSGDTWATLSQKHYGTPDYSQLLQFYNDNIELSELGAGSVIYIPNINNATQSIFFNNEVYNSLDSKDIFGVDIKINDKGDLEYGLYDNGDFKVVYGVDNLNQAISNRLSTSINTRVRSVVYGIRDNSGMAASDMSAVESYITESIVQTLVNDPRIESISGVKWNSPDGSTINVEVIYRTIVGSDNKLITNIS